MSSFDTQTRLAQVGRQSVSRLRDYVKAGALSAFATVDPVTGDVLDTEARALFASLPAVTPATAPDELVGHGLLPALPPNWAAAYAAPKYLVGREVFVKTTVRHHGDDLYRPVGVFDPQGGVGFTHRGVLRGMRGESFLVAIPEAPDVLPFARTDVYAWNEPSGVPSSGGTLSGVQVDYNDPRLKAYICAGYLEIAADLARLDFTADSESVAVEQARLIHRLAARMHMVYPGRGQGYGGSRAGSLIDGGQGVCFVQRAVAAAYLQAYARVLAFEVQVAIGRTLRLGVPHGFLVLTLRPSMKRYVCDPAWFEPLTDLRVAFFGPGWGHDRRLEGFEGQQELIVRPAEVDLPEVATS